LEDGAKVKVVKAGESGAEDEKKPGDKKAPDDKKADETKAAEGKK